MMSKNPNDTRNSGVQKAYPAYTGDGNHGWTRFGSTPASTSFICVRPPALSITGGAKKMTPRIRIPPWIRVVHETAYIPPTTVYRVIIMMAMSRASQRGMSNSHMSTMLIAVYCPTR